MLLHPATPAPGDPSLQSFRNVFRSQHVDIEIPSSENPPNLQIFKSNPSHSLDFFCLNLKKKTNPNPMEFSSSTRLAIQFGSSTSRLAASRLRMNITPKKKKRREKTGQKSNKRFAQHEICLLYSQCAWLPRVSCQGEWHRRMQMRHRSVLRGSHQDTKWASRPKQPSQHGYYGPFKIFKSKLGPKSSKIVVDLALAVYHRLALAQHEIWLLIRLARVSCQGEWYRRMQMQLQVRLERKLRRHKLGTSKRTNAVTAHTVKRATTTLQNSFESKLCPNSNTGCSNVLYTILYIYRYILDDGTSVIKDISCLVSALV